MDLSAYVSFKGQCEEAFRFYEKVFGAKPGLIFRFADSPMADVVPEGWDGKVMHGSIKIGDSLLEGADVPPERYEEPKGIALSVNASSAGEADSLFEQLAQGGRILYPIAKSFWSERFGMVIDRFGVPWQINCEVR